MYAYDETRKRKGCQDDRGWSKKLKCKFIRMRHDCENGTEERNKQISFVGVIVKSLLFMYHASILGWSLVCMKALDDMTPHHVNLVLNHS
mmetsp:Transcript_27533/g.53492  ORF Transcript_27533/g.53492 Transcript_27533/m.53492 type:complete len:90 (-) Transcript_27533:566-835(-)